jgi:tetratricopeptide (TPR) repeat protein
VELNPHHAFSNNVLCSMLASAGQSEEAISWGERALQLNPTDPQNFLFLTHLALAQLGAGNYEKSAELARDVIRQRPDFDEPHILLASALGYLDRIKEAAEAMGPFAETATEFIEGRLYWADVTKQCVRDGLRKAGLAA